VNQKESKETNEQKSNHALRHLSFFDYFHGESKELSKFNDFDYSCQTENLLDTYDMLLHIKCSTIRCLDFKNNSWESSDDI